MKITLYKYSGDDRVINKTLTEEKELEGTLRDQADILSPVIGLQTDPRDYNYVYIPEFNRYYFVHTITQYRKNIWILNLKCDVLKSYEQEIMELSGIVSQLNDTNYIDGAGVFDVRDTHERIDFADELSLGSRVLIVRGK